MMQLFASAAKILTVEPPAGVFTVKALNTLPAAAGRATEDSSTAAFADVLALRDRVEPATLSVGLL
jgi:hypothetical protein